MSRTMSASVPVSCLWGLFLTFTCRLTLSLVTSPSSSLATPLTNPLSPFIVVMPPMFSIVTPFDRCCCCCCPSGCLDDSREGPLILPELLVEEWVRDGDDDDGGSEEEEVPWPDATKEGSPVWCWAERRALFKGGGVNPPSDSLSPDEARLTTVHFKESSLFLKGTRLLVLSQTGR